MGNVDFANTLVPGTLLEVKDETVRVIQVTAPGGGFVLTSSNSIHSGVPYDHYMTMLETARKYGSYLINIVPTN